MQTHYIQSGRRQRIPSSVEVLDELLSGYVPGNVRKNWTRFGFVKPGTDIDKSPIVCGEALAPTTEREVHLEPSLLPIAHEVR